MTQWFDPISERWHTMPDPQWGLIAPDPPLDIYAQSELAVHRANVWDALVATSLASQQE